MIILNSERFKIYRIMVWQAMKLVWQTPKLVGQPPHQLNRKLHPCAASFETCQPKTQAPLAAFYTAAGRAAICGDSPGARRRRARVTLSLDRRRRPQKDGDTIRSVTRLMFFVRKRPKSGSELRPPAPVYGFADLVFRSDASNAAVVGRGRFAVRLAISSTAAVRPR